jgi:hypothetical protein
MLLLAIFSLLSGLVTAQSPSPRIEAGVQLSIIDQPALHEKPLAGGGRFTVKLFRFVDAEAEINRYPIGGAISVFPATQALIGARVGYRLGPIGLFAKARPGFMRFDENAYAPRLGTRANLDIGGILELYSTRHVAVRMDFGDTVIFYGREPMLSPVGGGIVPQPGTRHQLQASFGISAWF